MPDPTKPPNWVAEALLAQFCPSTYVGESGYRFTCDGLAGHTGMHHAQEYDAEHDCFRTAEWIGGSDV